MCHAEASQTLSLPSVQACSLSGMLVTAVTAMQQPSLAPMQLAGGMQAYDRLLHVMRDYLPPFGLISDLWLLSGGCICTVAACTSHMHVP